MANSNKVTKIGANLVSFSHASFSFVSETGLGDLDIQAGVLSLQGFVNAGDPTRTITIRSNATLEVANTGDNLVAKPIVMDDGACLMSRIPNIALPQYCALNGPITLGGRGVFDMVSGATVILNGEVGGTGPFVKGIGYHPASAPTSTGSGTVILTGNNSFTGELRVETGSLVLSNEASVAKASNIILGGGTLDVSNRVDGTLTLAGGQSLKGSGIVVGTVVSPAGTTVAPGESVGTLSVLGSATLRGTTVMELSKAGAATGSDQLQVSDTLSLGGTLNVTFSGEALATGDRFVLFTAGALAGQFASVNLPTVPGVVWTNKTALDGSIEVLSAAPAVPPEVEGYEQLADGNFKLLFSGPTGARYSVRAATSVSLPLVDWTVLGAGVFGASPASYADLDATNHPQRYYLITIP
jgi:autotransporter-associated beta strand protein